MAPALPAAPKAHNNLPVVAGWQKPGGMLHWLLLGVCLLASTFTTAQNGNYGDSNMVDTTSMTNIEAPLVDTVVVEEASGYNDQDDGYVDTSVEHIYDTSAYFFNWKSFYTDTFFNGQIQERHLLEGEVNALKQDDDFWYIPVIEKLEERLANDPAFRDSLLNAQRVELSNAGQTGLLFSPWVNTLLWLVAIGIFAAALVYFLVQNKISIFAREAAAANSDEENETAEDIFSLSYTKLIQQAEKDGDFRIAIRLMFLQVLRTLSDTNAIQYQPDYTNLYYLQQLSGTKYYNDFFTVMRHYEYVWYGKFAISPVRYSAIKSDFLKLQNRIR